MHWEARLLRQQGHRLLWSEYTWAKPVVRDLLWAVQDGRCLCCERRLQPHLRYPRCGDRDTIDHVWPVGFGGPDRLGNVALMTNNCNNRKGSRLPTQLELDRLRDINRVLGWRMPAIVLKEMF